MTSRLAVTLAKLMHAGARAHDVDEVISLVGPVAQQLTSADFVILGTFESGVLQFRDAQGMLHPSLRPYAPQSKGAIARMLQTRTTVVTHPTEGPLVESEGARTLLVAPLFTGDQVLGCVTLGWRSVYDPTPDQLQVAETLGDYASMLINNAQTHVRERERTAELHAVLEQLPCAVLVVDRKHNVLLRNRAGTRLTGMAGADSRRATRAGFQMVDADTGTPLPRDRWPLERAIAGEHTGVVEFALRRESDGDRIAVEASAAPLLDDDGHVVGAVLVSSDVTRERQLARELQARETHLREIYDAMACGVIVRAPDGSLIHANRAAYAMFDADFARGGEVLTGWTRVAADGQALGFTAVEEVSASGKAVHGLLDCLISPSGEMRWRRYDAVPIFDPAGCLREIVISFTDVTEQYQAEKALAAARDQLAGSEARYRTIVELANEGIAVNDLEGRYVYVNQRMCEMFGYSEAEMLRRTIWDFMFEDDIAQIRSQNLPVMSMEVRREVRLRARDGSEVWVLLATRSLYQDGELVGGMAILTDVRDRKAAEAALVHRAMHDELTGLPNRALLTDRLVQATAGAKRDSSTGTLLFVDLDGFKEINDLFGHQMGDAVLVELARRLREALRGTDTVARLGGDEFAVILPSCGLAQCEPAARKVLDTLSEPMVMDGRELRVSGSIGAVLFPDDGDDVSTLMRHADSAMYQAKRNKLGLVVFASRQPA